MKLRLLPVLLVAVALVASGCTGKDAVVQGGGGQFRFVSGTGLGKTYAVADRKKAGNFTGTLLNGGGTAGGKLSLAQDAGKVVVVNFWATWCGPCTTETPQFDNVYRAYKSKGVAFIGVDTKDSPSSKGKSFIRDNDISYPNIYDEQGETALQLGHIPALSFPFTVLIDRQGRVAAVYLQALTPKDLEPVLNKLLAESSMLLADPGFTHTVTDGPLLAAAGVAALVGVVGFLSPCVLPLVPGYLSYVAGLSGADAAQNARPSQRRMFGGALLFVLGFSAIFVLEGVLFGSLGAAIRDHTVAIDRVLGVITIVMGVVFLGGIGFLQREFKVHRLPSPGLLGAPLLGAAFGLAWIPCLTPTFGAVYSMSLIEGTAGRGAFLMFCYCLGLGVPFILVALGVGWVSGALGFVRRHMGLVSRIGGVLLIVIGILLVTGQWTTWMGNLRSAVGPNSGFSL